MGKEVGVGSAGEDRKHQSALVSTNLAHSDLGLDLGCGHKTGFDE